MLYSVRKKTTSEEVSRYVSQTLSYLDTYPLTLFDHVEITEEPVDPGIPDSAWKIWPGSLKDRLGVDALAIAASNHPYCVAAIEMLRDRKYVDLKAPQTNMLFDMLIVANQPEANPLFPGSSPMTIEKKNNILNTPANQEEQYYG